MSLGKQLTFKLPILLGSACFLAGCYTMLRHPATELTQAHGGDAQYSDCGSCHEQGFDEPLLRDPYGYTNYGFWSYYGCPWWLTDCGLSYAYGSAQGPGWSGGGGGGAYGRPSQTDEDGRAVGSRGEVRELPSRLPTVSPPSGGGLAAPGTNLSPSESATGSGRPFIEPGAAGRADDEAPCGGPRDPGRHAPRGRSIAGQQERRQERQAGAGQEQELGAGTRGEV